MQKLEVTIGGRFGKHGDAKRKALICANWFERKSMFKDFRTFCTNGFLSIGRMSYLFTNGRPALPHFTFVIERVAGNRSRGGVSTLTVIIVAERRSPPTPECRCKKAYAKIMPLMLLKLYSGE